MTDGWDDAQTGEGGIKGCGDEWMGSGKDEGMWGWMDGCMSDCKSR